MVHKTAIIKFSPYYAQQIFIHFNLLMASFSAKENKK